MRLSLIPLFIVPCAVPTQAQTGPCTESAIKQGTLPAADDVFSYMPPYGKPVVGKPAIQAANAKSFSARTNSTRAWVGDHRIVSTPPATWPMSTAHFTWAMTRVESTTSLKR